MVLTTDIMMAEKIVKTAKIHHHAVRNYDQSERLIQALRENRPTLIVLDWDTREAEAYGLLKWIVSADDYRGVPVIGFSSRTGSGIQDEARRAGCDRVYPKAAFVKNIGEFLVRYGK